MKTFTFIITLFFLNTHISGQTPSENQWAAIPLTGESFKLFNNFKSYFSIQLTTGKLFSASENSQYNHIETQYIQNALFENENAMQDLLEQFNGEFFIGSNTGGNQNIGNAKAVENWHYGLSLTYRLSRKLGVDAGYSRHNTSVSGQFPVTTFNSQTYEPIELEGQLATNFKHNRIWVATEYYFLQGKFQPFVTLGAAYQSTAETTTKVEINGIVFPLEINPREYGLNPFGKIGIVGYYKTLTANWAVTAMQDRNKQKMRLGFQLGIGFLVF